MHYQKMVIAETNHVTLTLTLTMVWSHTLLSRLLPNTTSICVLRILCVDRFPLSTPSYFPLHRVLSRALFIDRGILIVHVEGLVLIAASCARMPAMLAPGSKRKFPP